MTNEQAVLDAQKEGNRLRERYSTTLYSYICKEKPKQSDLLNLHRSAIAYFNHYETFVANSDLLGAHRSEHWAQTFAEDCMAILDTIAKHFETMLEQKERHFPNMENVLPTVNAFASMQRMVKEYCRDDQVKVIRAKFVQTKLPTEGFDHKLQGSKDVRFYRNVSLVFGPTIIVALLIVIFVFPELTKFQQSALSAVLPVGIAFLVNLLPGALELKAKLNIGLGREILLTAVGAVAVFIFVYLTL